MAVSRRLVLHDVEVPEWITSVKDIEVFKAKLHKNLLSKMPNKPPVKGYKLLGVLNLKY